MPGFRVSYMLILSGVMAVGFASRAGVAADWPQWRGPSLDGRSPNQHLPIHWGADKNVKWRVPLPSWSGSTPIVWGDRVLVSSAGPVGGATAPTLKQMGGSRPAEGLDLLLLCLSREDGRLLWQVKLDEGNAHYGKQNLSSPSPVTDGKHLWAMTGTGVFTALTMDGKVLWRRELQKEYGEFGQLWGYASSPLLLEGRLFVEVLHGSNTDAPSYLMAIDPISGKNIWKVDRPTDAKLESPDAYTTPAPLREGGLTMIVVSGGDYITANSAADGHEVWRCAGLNPEHNDRWREVSSPEVVALSGGQRAEDGPARRDGDGADEDGAVRHMVLASVRNGPLVACRAGGKGVVTDTHLAWSSKIAPDVPTPVSDGQYVYVLQDRGMLSCLELETGKPLYEKQRLPRGTYSASPLLADGKLYLTNEDAHTAVVAAGPKFKLLGENELDGGYMLSSVAVAGQELFIRTAKYLYCIAEPGRPQASK